MNESMPRIALFISSLSGGGAERVMVLLANSIAERGYPVDLVLGRASGPYMSSVAPSVRIVNLNASRNIKTLLPFVRYLRREKPDSVLSALPDINCIAIVAKIIAGANCRLVISVHNTLSQAVSNTTSRRFRFIPMLARITFPRADSVIAVSRGVAEDLAVAIGFRHPSTHVIYNPVVTDQLMQMAQMEVAHPWFKNGGEALIVAAGRLIEQKDFSTLLHAFRLVLNDAAVRLVILGEGELREKLASLAVELGIEQQVDFAGFVDNPYALMARAKLFVMSSAWEGFGVVLVEAMACGTQVVSTDCPYGPSEILEGGVWGRLAKVRDQRSLADNILRALSDCDPPDVKRRARDFTADHAVSRYLPVLVGEAL